MTLFDPAWGSRAPSSSVRRSDPDTSVAAAKSVSGAIDDRLLRWFQTWRWSGTDDDLCYLFHHLHGPTVRTARSRLSKAGLVVDTGERRLSNRGRAAIVWKAAS